MIKGVHVVHPVSSKYRAPLPIALILHKWLISMTVVSSRNKDIKISPNVGLGEGIQNATASLNINCDGLAITL